MWPGHRGSVVRGTGVNRIRQQRFDPIDQQRPLRNAKQVFDLIEQRLILAQPFEAGDQFGRQLFTGQAPENRPQLVVNVEAESMVNRPDP